MEIIDIGKKSRTDGRHANFVFMYTYEGKMFVKKVRLNSPDDSIHISNSKMMKKFLDGLKPVQISNLELDIPPRQPPLLFPMTSTYSHVPNCDLAE